MSIVYSKIQRFTGSESDLAALEEQIETARANYKKYVDEYNWGLANGSTKYAENTRKPRMNSALEVLNTLLAQKAELLKTEGVKQNIDIIKQITNDTTGKQSTSGLPWATIGLTVGALVAIVLLIRFIK